MLLRLSRTKYAAWCDACLRGSPVIANNAPLVARFLAIEALRADGWLHVTRIETTNGSGAPSSGAPSKSAREDAERSWTGETYCIDCATNQRMRRGA
jgi:hypothetical protein